MLSLFKRTPPATHTVNTIEDVEYSVEEPVRRNKQQNIKTSEDCRKTFEALARVLRMSKSALFEDLVAARLEELQRQGVQVEIA